MATSTLEFLIEAKNRTGPAFAAMNGDLNRLERSMKNNATASNSLSKSHEQLGKSTTQTQSRFQSLTQTIQNHSKLIGGAMLGAAAAIVGAYAMIGMASVQAAAESEKNWNSLNSTMGRNIFQMEATKKEFGGLIETIVSDTSRLRGDVTKTIGDLYRYGVVHQDVLKTTTESIAGLAALTQKDFSTVEDSYVGLINKPKLMSRTVTSMGLDFVKFNNVLKNHNYTLADWGKLTTEQRANLLNETVAMMNGQKANEAYANSYEGMVNQLTNAYKRFMVTIGNELIPVLKDLWKQFGPGLKSAVEWFSKLSTPMKNNLFILAALVPLVMGLGGAILLLKPVTKPLFDLAVKGAQTLLDKIGVINKTPCTPKECLITAKTQCAGTTPTGQQPGVYDKYIAPAWGIISGVGATLLSRLGPRAIMNAGSRMAGLGGSLAAIPGLMTAGTMLQSGLSYASGGQILSPEDLSKIRGKGLENIAGDFKLSDLWTNKATGPGALDWLLPKGPWTPSNLLPGQWGSYKPGGGVLPDVFASAAGGKGGKSSIMQDIFGKGGVLDFSRFKITWPKLTLPAFSITNISNAMNQAKTWVMNGINQITGFFRTLPGKVGGALGGLWGAIATPFNNALNYVKSIARGAANSVSSAFWGLVGSAGGAWKSIAGAVSGPINTIIGWINRLRGALGMGTFKGMTAGGKGGAMQIGYAGGDITPGTANVPSTWSTGESVEQIMGSIIPDERLRTSVLSQMYGSAGGDVGCLDGTCGFAGGDTGGSGIFGVGNWPSTIMNSVYNMANGFFGRFGTSAQQLLSAPGNAMIGMFKRVAAQVFNRMRYEFYYNSRYNDAGLLAHGAGNCWDMTRLLIDIARGFGLSGSVVHGYWGSIPHVWANIQGIGTMDPTSYVQRGHCWTCAPGGHSVPSSMNVGLGRAGGYAGGGAGGGTTIIIQGDIYGYNDFIDKVEQATNKIFSNTW